MRLGRGEAHGHWAAQLALAEDDGLLDGGAAGELEAEAVLARVDRDGAGLELVGEGGAVEGDLDVGGVVAVPVPGAEHHRGDVVVGVGEPGGAVGADEARAGVAAAREEAGARGEELALVAEDLPLVGGLDARVGGVGPGRGGVREEGERRGRRGEAEVEEARGLAHRRHSRL